MDAKGYPVGRGAVKPKYINGTLVFNEGPLVPGVTHTLRNRATAAEVNAGKVLLAAIPGYKYRLLDCKMIAIGGAAATATSVDILGTAGGSAVRPVVNAVAGLTENTLLRAGAANSAILAAGASFTALDANASVSVTKQAAAGDLATATHIDVLLDFTIEAA